jgi:cysteine desulfurase / selenocysteine lyase
MDSHGSNGSPVHRFDVRKVRADFPILQTTAHGKPLVYLDNGATTQKPRAVIDRLVRFYEHENANIHRGVYELSQRATTAYEEAREKIARFINARETREVIFTRGTTEGVNLVAAGFGRKLLKPGDEIILSAMEHHSNIVPWQLAAEQAGATIRVIPMNDAGELLLDEYEQLLNERTRLVSVVHVSNSLGTVNDVKRIVELAHRVGAKVLVDGAQWVAHHRTDVQAIGCDFYVFSGHKLFGPTGIGALWGRAELLEQLPPYQGGGDMIESVTFEKTTYAQLPSRLEAGTPDIAGAIGLGAAIDYLQSIGFENFEPHEAALLKHATEQLGGIPGLRIIGTADKKGGVISFVIDNPPISSLDVGTRLDQQGIAVRTGHHCCQPVMDRMRVPATIRASIALYNTTEEIDALAAALRVIVGDAGRKSRPVAKAASTERIRFPHASEPTVTKAADRLESDLADLAAIMGREAVGNYISEIGDQLLPMPDALKVERYRVPGCMSIVYLFVNPAPSDRGTVEFLGWSDSAVVRGLIAILQRLFSGQQASDVLAYDVESFFRRAGLDEFTTTLKRRGGLLNMIRAIRTAAQALSAAEPVAR